MATYCDFYGMSSDSCAHCTGRTGGEKVEILDVAEISAVFTARFPGRCASCEGAIAVGDRIGRTTDGDYVCVKHLPVLDERSNP